MTKYRFDKKSVVDGYHYIFNFVSFCQASPHLIFFSGKTVPPIVFFFPKNPSREAVNPHTPLNRANFLFNSSISFSRSARRRLNASTGFRVSGACFWTARSFSSVIVLRRASSFSPSLMASAIWRLRPSMALSNSLRGLGVS